MKIHTHTRKHARMHTHTRSSHSVEVLLVRLAMSGQLGLIRGPLSSFGKYRNRLGDYEGPDNVNNIMKYDTNTRGGKA